MGFTTKSTVQRIAFPIRNKRKYDDFKRKYPGLMAEVARDLDIYPTGVVAFVKGFSPSRRIHEALLVKIAEWDRERGRKRAA